MSFKDGRIGVGKDPIFPLDISGSCRIDGDLILGGRFSDSQGNAIQLGSGSGATSTPDQTKVSLPSWQGGTITTQGLGVFKGVQDPVKKSLYINGDSAFNMGNTTGSYNTTVGYEAGVAITGGGGNVIVGRNAGRYINNGANNVMVGNYAGHAYNSTENVFIGKFSGYANSKSHNVSIGCDTMQQAYPTEYSVAIGYMAGYGAGGENQIYIGREAGKSTASYSLQTGHNNTGIGAYALNKITSGNHNIGIGYYAGQNCQTNSSNVFIGQQAGREFSGSDYNIGIGTLAMYNSAGGHNIALGYAALQGASGTQSHANNIAMGFEALKFVTSGSNNVVIGYQSGVSVTTGGNNITLGKTAGFNITTGNFNVAIGYGSLRTSTTAYSNVSIGPSSGYSLTTGFENVYIGNGAGYHSTTSSKNVFIGLNAGMSNTTGYENVMIGERSGESGNGQHNTFIGARTGQGNSSGNYNTFIGRYAGKDNTGGSNTFIGSSAGNQGSGNDNVAIGMQSRVKGTGSGNIMIGRDTGFSLTSGQYNTNIGHNSNKDCTWGSFNAFLGSASGQFNTTGSYNVCIGNNTNIYNKTGSYNIIIGSNAAHAASTSVANKDYELYINSHNGYYGDSSFIYGYMKMNDNPFIIFNCNVGIGTTSPSQKLEVKGNILFNNDATWQTAVINANSSNDNTWQWLVGGSGNSVGIADAMCFYYAGDTTNAGNKVTIKKSGRVGIGTTGPGYPLQVNGGVSSSTGITGHLFYARHNAHASNQYTYTNTNISVKCENGLWASTLFAQSDRRIKENIIDVPDNLALEMVRNIPCRYYDYKDKIGKGKETTIGFIAQEVKEILPMAVGNEKDFIPNELRNLENISWEEIKDNSDNIINYKLTSDLSDCSGIKYRFYVSNDPSGNDEVIKEVVGNSDNSFTFDTSYNNVFCYGKEVNDFHTLDKQKLFTLNFSATQELDRKVIALEKENQDQNVKILDLYKENQSLKARLAKIEAFLGL